MNNELAVPRFLESNVVSFNELILLSLVSKCTFIKHFFVNSTQNSHQVVQQKDVGKVDVHPKKHGVNFLI